MFVLCWAQVVRLKRTVRSHCFLVMGWSQNLSVLNTQSPKPLNPTLPQKKKWNQMSISFTITQTHLHLSHCFTKKKTIKLPTFSLLGKPRTHRNQFGTPVQLLHQLAWWKLPQCLSPLQRWPLWLCFLLSSGFPSSSGSSAWAGQQYLQSLLWGKGRVALIHFFLEWQHTQKIPQRTKNHTHSSSVAEKQILLYAMKYYDNKFCHPQLNQEPVDLTVLAENKPAHLLLPSLVKNTHCHWPWHEVKHKLLEEE